MKRFVRSLAASFKKILKDNLRPYKKSIVASGRFLAGHRWIRKPLSIVLKNSPGLRLRLAELIDLHGLLHPKCESDVLAAPALMTEPLNAISNDVVSSIELGVRGQKILQILLQKNQVIVSCNAAAAAPAVDSLK